MTNIIPFPARAEKPRHPFTDPRLIAIVEGLCSCERANSLRPECELHWPADTLLMTVVREWNKKAHAVLTVVTNQGEFVLDNKSWVVEPIEDAPYVWLKRQSRYREYVWVDLDKASAKEASETYPPISAPIPFIESAQRVKTASTRP